MEKEKKQIAKEAIQAIQYLEESVKLETVIKDNKAEFKIGDTIYRVRKPILIEQDEVLTAKRKKYIELVDDENYLFRKQWVEKYKKKGIDVDKMEDDIRRLDKEIKNILLRLAQTTEPKSIDSLKNQILKLRDQQKELAIERTDFLSHSIEDQLLIFINSYTTYVVLEKKEKEKWVRCFKNYTDFEHCQEIDLINKAFYYISCIMYGV